MAGTTTNFSWPFPTPPDPANVAPDMQALISAADATLGNAYTAYTPVWTSAGVAPALGTGTLVGRFKRFSKWGVFRITLTASAATTFGTLAYRFTLPAGWQLFDITSLCGTGAVVDASVTNTTYTGTVWPVTAGPPATVELRTHSAASAVTNLVPITLATSDIIALQGLVELA